MNLPLVIDIAIGLIFIYLTLSLLTSEIQELVATLLQWRAEHLKKSIEILLTGESSSDPTFQKFADQLYSSPLIKALNQEAKGSFARFFRRVSQTAGDLYRLLTRNRNVFGSERSGPSYIPSETFAVALLQKLDVETLSQKMSELAIRKVGNEKLALLQDVIDALRNSVGDDSLLETELDHLKRSLDEIIADFVGGRATLSTSLGQVTSQLGQFIDNTEAALADHNHCKEIIRSRLPYLKQAVLLKRLEPTIAEVISLILNQNQSLPPQISELLARISRNNPDIPQQLKQNLTSLAKQAQLKAEGLEDGVRQLEKELQDWFDRSMERASGVYRRNAKGIAILLGFLVAIMTNADTFHIVHRLSKDTLLRSTISQSADQVIVQTIASGQTQNSPSVEKPTNSAPGESSLTTTEPIQQNLETVKNAVNAVLDELPLPLGWASENVQQQREEDQNWFIPYSRRVLGWLISGIALSMGSSFWFDLLGKIIKVRNSGKPIRSDNE